MSERRDDIEQPPAGPEAFAGTRDAHGQAAAAILLSMAVQLRGDDIKEVSRSAAVGVPVSPLAAVADDEFPIPPLRPMNRRLPHTAAVARARAFRDSGPLRAGSRFMLANVAERVYSEPTHENAAALAAMSMEHQDLLVRVAAANAMLAMSSDVEESLSVLLEGLRSGEELTRDVAATTLGRYFPEHDALRSLTSPDGGDRPDFPPSRTSMLIHGTWARGNAWWQPGGDFHTYVRNEVWQDLYGAPDRYDWSGGYSDGARLLASQQLVRWISERGMDDISLMPHSHGGSVAMLASWNGVRFNRLVLLACPVHPAKYSANFAAVGKVTSVRVKADLVLLADGSGSRFTDPRYNEHVLPVWFNHSAPHHPAVWRRFNIPAML